MGNGKWSRHVIINTQPADSTSSNAAEWLQRKPIRSQGQERRKYNFDDRFQLKSEPTDKVYVVGHGNTDNQTLGGQQPEFLAGELLKGVESSPQLNLVMCGTSELALARRFAKTLFRRGYAGKVYAYETVMAVDPTTGRKHAGKDDPEMAKLLGVTEYYKAVPKVIAEFGKESFAEEFAAESKDNEALLELLHGGSGVAASDDGGKSEQGSLLEK